MIPKSIFSAVTLALLTSCNGAGHDGAPTTGAQHAEHPMPASRSESSPVSSPASAEQPSEHAESASATTPIKHEPVPAMPEMPANTDSSHKDYTRTSAPEGYSNITLDVGRARGLALTTAPVEWRDFTRSLRTVGIVALDETKTSHVHSKVRGWIDTINVDFIGKSVRKGQPLLSIYSQEVYAAELEFLSILQQPALGPGVTGEFALAERDARERLLAGARQRLSLWDVPRGEIERLEHTRTARRTFTLDAPRRGIVLTKQALAGMFIDPSLELYLISDVRKLWVLADVYDSDVPFVKIGDNARLSIEGAAQPVAAKIAFISPTIDEATRTLKVRFEVDNRDEKLRPGAFVTVEMDLKLDRGLAVPEDAVIRTGPRSIVFVVNGDRVEPREVQLGPNVAGQYRVVSGLNAGESVATGAQFLLDSESRLRASSAPGGGHAAH